MRNNIKPFLKWVGGKSLLIGELSERFPSNIKQYYTYIEPFVGGGAVMLHMLVNYPNFKNVIINDINENLMTVYRVVRDRVAELIHRLKDLQCDYWDLQTLERQSVYYLNRRNEFNARQSDDVEQAALFIFLNKTCFNGLYRVNRNNVFNVAIGKLRKPMICDDEQIIRISRLLQNVTISCTDYLQIVEHIQGNTFIYLDPPYKSQAINPSFTSYTPVGFDDDEQFRLSEFCHLLAWTGSKWLLSNSDMNLFGQLYKNYNIQKIGVAHYVVGIQRTTELLITNY